MRKTLLLAGALLAATVVIARAPAENETLPLNYAPSGKVMFKQYCASCHGADAQGDGPLAQLLKVPPTDLTMLARHNNGRFPRDQVTSVLEFGSGNDWHGSSEMPVWGPLFLRYDKNNERAVEQRIKNLCDYLASVQQN